jgi:hypothetical protein
VLLCAAGFGLYYLVNRRFDLDHYRSHVPVIVVALVALTVVHELIHGACWSIFTPHHFKDIEFGVMLSAMAPYCACLVPLKKEQHVFGTAMPLIVLGILPTIYAICSGSLFMLLTGIVMIVSAGGDMAIVLEMLKYKTACHDVKIFDHPTQVGFYLFEK